MSETTSKRTTWSLSNYWSSTFSNRDKNGNNNTYSDSSGQEFGGGVYSSFQNFSNGFKNPYWKSQVKNGQNATTSFSWGYGNGSSPYFSIKWDIEWVDGGGTLIGSRKGQTDGYARFDTLPVGVSVPPDVMIRVTNRCIRRFIDNCNEITSSFEAGQDAGEYHETLESIHRPLHSLHNSILSYLAQLGKLKRGIRNPASLRKVLADTYLEFRFGWLPLADDVGKLIADAGRHRFPVYPVRSSAKETFKGAVERQTFGSVGYLPGSCVRSMSSNTSVSLRYQGAIRSNADSTGRISQAQSLRLLPSDWLPTAWDLLPYSWIADYFTNVGDIIQSLSFVSSNLVWAKKSLQTEERISYSEVLPSFSPSAPLGYTLSSGSVWCDGGAGEMSSINGSRSAISPSDLVPKFEFQIPVSKFPYYNLAALYASRVKRLIPFF